MVGLLAFNSKGSGPYSHGAAGATFRFSFGAIAVLILWLAYYRTWRMKAVNNTWKSAKQKSKVQKELRCLQNMMASHARNHGSFLDIVSCFYELYYTGVTSMRATTCAALCCVMRVAATVHAAAI